MEVGKNLTHNIMFTASLNANIVLRSIPIYLNTEYHTDSPVISSISSTLTLMQVILKQQTFLITIPSVGLHQVVRLLSLCVDYSVHTLVFLLIVSIKALH